MLLLAFSWLCVPEVRACVLYNCTDLCSVGPSSTVAPEPTPQYGKGGG